MTMINNLQNMLAKVFYAPVSTTPAVTQQPSNNPFANPFVQTTKSNPFYGKNQPVKGGYFAGYYNNKPNIVGKRLFIEV